MLRTSDLRPRTIVEILDAAFALYRARFPSLFLTCLVFAIPVVVTTLMIAGDHGRAQAGVFELMMTTLEQSGSQDPEAQRQAAESAQRMQDLATGEIILFAALESAMQAISRAGALVAMSFAVWRAATGRPPAGTATLVKETLPRILPVAFLTVGIALMTALSSVLGAFACVWLGLLWAGGSVFAPAGAVAALERGPGERALREAGGLRTLLLPFAIFGHLSRRMFRLVASGTAFARATLLVFLLGSVLSIVSLVAGLVCLQVFGSLAALLVAQQLADVVMMPFFGSALAIWYLDLRVRREGLDLNLTLQPEAPTARRGASRTAFAAAAWLALGAGAAFAGAPPDADAVRAARARVFERPEFQYGGPRGESALSRLLARINQAAEEFAAAHPVLFVVILGVLLVILVVIVAHMVWTMRKATTPLRRVHDEKALVAALRRLDARPFRDAAEAAAREGRLDDAVRALYAALLVTLDHRGAARYGTHKTLADYCAETDAAGDVAARDVLRGFESAYPPGSFGRRPPDAATYARLLAAVDSLAATRPARPVGAGRTSPRGGHA